MNNKMWAITAWVLSIICAIIFLLASLGKFSFEGNMYDNFIKWGYNGFLLLSVGVFELLGAIFLLIPKLRKYGVFSLIIVMIGASVTHFINFEELGFPLFSLGLIVVLTGIYLIDGKIK